MHAVSQLAPLLRQRTPLVAAALAGFALLSLLCLHYALALQTTRDSESGIERVRERLQLPLQLDQQALLRERVRELLGQPELGLHYVEIADAAGIVLVAAGRQDGLRLPLLPDALERQLRLAWYRLSSEFGQASVRAQGRPVGSFVYAIRPSAPAGAADRAAQGLRAAGVLGLFLSLAGAGVLLWVLRSPQPAIGATQQVLRRAAGPGAAQDAVPPAEQARIVQRMRDRLGVTLDQMGQGLLTADRDGRVRYLNQTAEALTGWPVDAAEGRPLYSVFRSVDEGGAPHISAAEQCLRDGSEVRPLRCRLRTRSGQETPIEMMAAALKSSDGLPDGVAMLFSNISERQQELEALRRESRLSQGVIDHLDEGLITSDRAGVVRFANARALRMFGYSRDEIDGYTISKLMPVPFLNTPDVSLSDYVAGTRADGETRPPPRVVGWRKNATTFPVELEVQPLNVGADSGLILIVRDISERQRSENLAQRLGRLLDAAVEEIYIFDAQSLKFLEINRGACRNLGVGFERLSRLTLPDISAGLERADLQAHLDALRAGAREQVIYQCRHRRADGSDYPVEVRLSYSRDENPPVFMAIATDISDRLIAEDRLRHLAHHDALTGLPNRRVFNQYMQEVIDGAARRGGRSAVLFVDLDHFKQINDSLGHDAGDLVLRRTAELLLASVRASDKVARLGGDEFAVLAWEIRSADDAERVAQKLLAAFAESMQLNGQPQQVTPSIGIAIYPDHGATTADLLRQADAAMYQAKQAGRACYRVATGT